MGSRSWALFLVLTTQPLTSIINRDRLHRWPLRPRNRNLLRKGPHAQPGTESVPVALVMGISMLARQLPCRLMRLLPS